MAGEIIKDARLNVRMTSDIMSRFQAIAKDMGISVSALGAVAIAEYVTSRERQNKIVQAQVRATTKVIEDSVKPENLMAIASAMFGDKLQTDIAVLIDEFNAANSKRANSEVRGAEANVSDQAGNERRESLTERSSN